MVLCGSSSADKCYVKAFCCAVLVWLIRYVGIRCYPLLAVVHFRLLADVFTPVVRSKYWRLCPEILSTVVIVVVWGYMAVNIRVLYMRCFRMYSGIVLYVVSLIPLVSFSSLACTVSESSLKSCRASR